MAIKGTPFQGRDAVIMPRVYTGLTLVLYTNAANSLDDASTGATLVAPVGTGYAPIALNGVWSSSLGVVTYDHGTPDDPVFQNTGGVNWSAQVTGAAILAGASLLHFMDDPNGPVTLAAGKKYLVDLSSLVA